MFDVAPYAGLLARQGALPDIGSDAPDAIGLGRHFSVDSRKVGGRMRYGSERHVLVFGPNGSGKGTRLLVPNLLQSSGRSIFVVDPKGELAAITAPYRRTLGPVVIINPFGVLTDIPGYRDLASRGFNPLSHLDPSARSFNADASRLADAMIKVEGKDPHWSTSARALIAALIMHVVIEARAAGRVPSIATVRELLCMDSKEPNASNDHQGVGIPALALQMLKSPHVGLRNKAAQFVDWTNEVRSIVSSAKIQTESFDDLEIAEDMARDSFDFRDMKRGPVTVYCILPPDMMERHSKWLRMVITAALQAVMRPRLRGEPKVLFMLDEFASLGHMEIIETAWSLVRGYGIQIMPVFQDLTQLKGLYGDRWETFIANAGAVASFGPNDLTTSEWWARRGGDTTEVIESYHHGTSTAPIQFNNPNSGGTTTSDSTNYTQTKVPLIDGNKLFGMPTGTMLVTVAGLRHIAPAYAPLYADIDQCRQRARANPYYWSDDVDDDPDLLEVSAGEPATLPAQLEHYTAQKAGLAPLLSALASFASGVLAG